MPNILTAGGWVMLPIGLCSILVLTIAIERFLKLRKTLIIPPGLNTQIQQWLKHDQLDNQRLDTLRNGSAMGCILAAGLINRCHERDIIREAIEDQGRFVAHELNRYLGLLGTIGMLSPVLGLLGTVLGMIRVFEDIAVHGLGDPLVLSTGISQALISTAAGLIVALPAIALHHAFSGRVNGYIVHMEQEAVRLVEVLSGQREDETA